MKKMQKIVTKARNTNKGITLMALVITIIILLILAGITIGMITGENGIIGKATDAKLETEKSDIEEQINTIVIRNSESYTMDKDKLIEDFEDELPGEKEITDNGDTIEITYPEYSFEVDISTGKVAEIIIQENTAESPEYWEKTTKNDSEWYSYTDVSNGNQEVKVNAPKLKGAMTPIKYIGADKADQTGSKWANAITQDGSMFVWIPRYAYKITSGYHDSEEGTIDVIFIDTNNRALNGENETIITDPSKVTYTDDGTGNQVQNEYLVHPAFTASAENGGGFGQITGIWIAKFETTGTKETITVKAGESSLRDMTINEQYQAGKSATFGETVNLQSHMAKNSEWGATVYLAHSKYGTNGQKVEKQASGYITGGSSTKSEIYVTNKKQSITYNAYGVYGMNGGIKENTASYVNYGDNMGTNAKNYGGYGEEGSILGEDSEERATSTEYKTVYEAEGTSYGDSYNNKAKNKKGDGVYETSDGYNAGSYGWFDAYVNFPDTSSPFFSRGGYYSHSNAGPFYFSNDSGFARSDASFRVVLVP